MRPVILLCLLLASATLSFAQSSPEISPAPTTAKEDSVKTILTSDDQGRPAILTIRKGQQAELKTVDQQNASKQGMQTANSVSRSSAIRSGTVTAAAAVAKTSQEQAKTATATTENGMPLPPNAKMPKPLTQGSTSGN